MHGLFIFCHRDSFPPIWVPRLDGIRCQAVGILDLRRDLQALLLQGIDQDDQRMGSRNVHTMANADRLQPLLGRLLGLEAEILQKDTWLSATQFGDA